MDKIYPDEGIIEEERIKELRFYFKYNMEYII